MLVAFIGDVHGRVFLALAALAICQRMVGRTLDLVIQVGDMGAFPDLDRVDPATGRYLAADPSEADFSRFLKVTGVRTDQLRRLRQEFACPIHFIRGNHEDFDWLTHLPINPATKTAPVDPFDLLRYVPDGTFIDRSGLQIAFIGGAGDDASEEGAIDPIAHQALIGLGTGKVDLLVTHDVPHGISRGYRGDLQGSRRISELMETLQPTFHVAGHLTLMGPRDYGRTTFLCLSGLTESTLWRTDEPGLKAGCMALLDTSAGRLTPVTDPWLVDVETPIDFDRWFDMFFEHQAC